MVEKEFGKDSMQKNESIIDAMPIVSIKQGHDLHCL